MRHVCSFRIASSSNVTYINFLRVFPRSGNLRWLSLCLHHRPFYDVSRPLTTLHDITASLASQRPSNALIASLVRAVSDVLPTIFHLDIHSEMLDLR